MRWSKEPSRRQKQVIELLSLGLANKEIAGRLGLTEDTISQYVSKIYRDYPEMGRRPGAVRIQVRDHQRVMAIRLSAWITQYGQTLEPLALSEINQIMADQVVEFLK